MAPAAHTERSAGVKVWDVAVRLFHVLLISTYIIAWISADEWDRGHEIAGYVIGGLVGIRLIWGFIGTKHARFADFVYTPAAIYRYLRTVVAGRAKRYLGHNPAGGAMVVALLASLIAVTVTGIMMTSNAYWGAEWVEELHEASAFATVILVGLHIAGVVFSSIEHRENLVKSMITGFKRRLSREDA